MSAIDRFLDAVTSGRGIPADLDADGAVADATVPNRRVTVRGGEAIASADAPWFAAPGRFGELERTPVPGGEVVRSLLTREEDGVPHAVHHCHVLTRGGDGRIAADLVVCGGRGDTALLAGDGRGRPMMGTVVDLSPRPVAGSVDELLAGARRLGQAATNERRSSAVLERVEVDGEPCVVKYVDVDHDFTMRVSGDIDSRIRRVWAAGLMDAAPAAIDHATLGAARWGRHGRGVALLMRDVSAHLVPSTDAPIGEDEHLAFLDGLAALSASLWEFEDRFNLLPHRLRWAWFGEPQLAGERELGFPEAVPRLAADGWARFARLVPGTLADAITALRTDPTPLSEAVRTTPQTFLHGDWKFGNLGLGPDGRVILLDWAYPGQGPVAHELCWYLALNRARLPEGHSKESTIGYFRLALEVHGIDTGDWWHRQLSLCLLGALVQFGWEKALGDSDDDAAELRWWVERATEGLALL